MKINNKTLTRKDINQQIVESRRLFDRYTQNGDKEMAELYQGFLDVYQKYIVVIDAKETVANVKE